MGTTHPQLFTIADSDGAAILDVDRGTISTLNDTGAFVWERMRQGESAEAIICSLAAATNEDAAVVEHDVREFMSSLRARHAVETP